MIHVIGIMALLASTQVESRAVTAASSHTARIALTSPNHVVSWYDEIYDSYFRGALQLVFLALAPDYTEVDGPSGKSSPRAAVVEWHRKQNACNIFRRFFLRNVDVKANSITATGSFYGVWRHTGKDGWPLPEREGDRNLRYAGVFEDTWILDDGRWLLFKSVYSPLTERDPRNPFFDRSQIKAEHKAVLDRFQREPLSFNVFTAAGDTKAANDYFEAGIYGDRFVDVEYFDINESGEKRVIVSPSLGSDVWCNRRSFLRTNSGTVYVWGVTGDYKSKNGEDAFVACLEPTFYEGEIQSTYTTKTKPGKVVDSYRIAWVWNRAFQDENYVRPRHVAPQFAKSDGVIAVEPDRNRGVVVIARVMLNNEKGFGGTTAVISLDSHGKEKWTHLYSALDKVKGPTPSRLTVSKDGTVTVFGTEVGTGGYLDNTFERTLSPSGKLLKHRTRKWFDWMPGPGVDLRPEIIRQKEGYRKGETITPHMAASDSGGKWFVSRTGDGYLQAFRSDPFERNFKSMGQIRVDSSPRDGDAKPFLMDGLYCVNSGATVKDRRLLMYDLATGKLVESLDISPLIEGVEDAEAKVGQFFATSGQRANPAPHLPTLTSLKKLGDRYAYTGYGMIWGGFQRHYVSYFGVLDSKKRLIWNGRSILRSIGKGR